MGFWVLFEVATMPILQFLIVGLVGAFLASGYCNVLSASARGDINKIVFYVFSPALIFASLARTVTLHDLISWWFMPFNIGIIFLIGTILGWLVVKILGLRESPVRSSTVIAIIIARYLLLPASGIGVVNAAAALGFLPQDPLFHYVLLVQFALPPAMSIGTQTLPHTLLPSTTNAGTMAQLFNVGEAECSFIFLWTYLAAAPALAIWSTVFMYTLS